MQKQHTQNRKFRLLLSKPMLWLIAQLVRLHTLTLRVQIINEEGWKQHYKAGGVVIFCSWHQSLYPLFYHVGKERAAVMISQSKDGELISGVCQRLGWRTIRGSSSKGGARALREMIAQLKELRIVGHVLDGPRGPAGEIKKGLMVLAKNTGAHLIPIFVEPQKAWFFRKSWDQFFVPKPFSKVTIRYDKPIPVNPDSRAKELDDLRLSLQEQMQSALR